jgi:uncharacterized protein YkwD
MRYQKLFFGLISFLIFIGGIFAFFYFFFGTETIKGIFETIPNIFLNEKNEESEEEILPIIKEDDNGKGSLTRAGIIQETNRRRELFEKIPLLENDELNAIAEIKLDDMFENQYFAHVSPKGEGVGDIAKERGYQFLLIGDNLALGNYRDEEEVVSAWMNSPGHRKNILEERYIEIGVATKEGTYKDRKVWMAVQVFAMPTSACVEPSEELKKEIDRKTKEAERLLSKKARLEMEIDAIRPRGSELHIQKVEEYNALIEEYNKIVLSLDKAIDEYNHQIKMRTECVNR